MKLWYNISSRYPTIIKLISTIIMLTSENIKSNVPSYMPCLKETGSFEAFDRSVSHHRNKLILGRNHLSSPLTSLNIIIFYKLWTILLSDFGVIMTTTILWCTKVKVTFKYL